MTRFIESLLPIEEVNVNRVKRCDPCISWNVNNKCWSVLLHVLWFSIPLYVIDISYRAHPLICDLWTVMKCIWLVHAVMFFGLDFFTCFELDLYYEQFWTFYWHCSLSLNGNTVSTRGLCMFRVRGYLNTTAERELLVHFDKLLKLIVRLGFNDCAFEIES